MTILMEVHIKVHSDVDLVRTAPNQDTRMSGISGGITTHVTTISFELSGLMVAGGAIYWTISS
ncbi:predicted protein [Botrytis cinerea T4]|uniref:Uncharacterized protein n=1 Tax=Botryotinia fuckeliana (strain T4) TaxID=999810 RepID=G2Y0B0_BOTF4|nr:predicted protein [Botrytis cinerea T4]